MRKLVVTAGALVLLMLSVAPASADTEGHWGAFESWESAPPVSSAVVTMPGVTGFPRATLSSDTAGGSDTSVGPQTGASAWLGAWTPPGGLLGSSRDLPYISLRPAANSATSPSTSTYVFDRPTPADGWAFVLGDVDAELLDVTALDAEGEPVPLSALGFQSTFNYCQGSPRPSGCSPTKAQPLPDVDPATGRLSGPEVDENGDPIPGWSDTDGASGWFRPTVSLSQITVTATWRTGFPTYQTWFGALSRDVSGSVSSATCEVGGLDVRLLGGDGEEVAMTTTDDDGRYAFDDLATYPGYTVEVDAPTGCDVVGTPAPADLSETDAVVDVELDRPDAGGGDGDDGGTGEETPGGPGGQDGAADNGSAGSDSGVDRAVRSLPDAGGPPVGVMVVGAVLFLWGLTTLVVGLRGAGIRRPRPASGA